ncbi:MAG TPA: 4Fe-4S dicluster domain-containing protein [Bacteroidales bacterium]|nr:4Fe-4S dicluster domain-containing protein [Bacteroidales bacterium]
MKRHIHVIMNRKTFLQHLGLVAGGTVCLSSTATPRYFFTALSGTKAIVVDYARCTGCRTCEAVCSASNHKVEIAGVALPGIGNPAQSNIKVWRYNPPADIAVTCFLCDDAPCVAACPVKPDPKTGRKALYRDENLQTIKCDANRCIGCQSCSDACRENRGQVLWPDDEGSPTGMCTLCHGDPQCVQWCPYGALSFLEITPDMPYREMHPDMIASLMQEKFYDTKKIQK